jgi:hypothetical protein
VIDSGKFEDLVATSPTFKNFLEAFGVSDLSKRESEVDDEASMDSDEELERKDDEPLVKREKVGCYCQQLISSYNLHSKPPTMIPSRR